MSDKCEKTKQKNGQKSKKVRYHKIKKFFVFWKVGSLLIMYPDMFFHD